MERTPPGSLAGSRAAARQQVLAQYAPARKVFLQPPPRPGLPAVIPPFSAQAQRLGQLRPGDAALGLVSTAPRPGGVLTKPLAPIVAAARLELNSMPAFETEGQRTARLQTERLRVELALKRLYKLYEEMMAAKQDVTKVAEVANLFLEGHDDVLPRLKEVAEKRVAEELEEEFYREARRMLEAQLKAPEAKAGQAAVRRVVEHMKLTTSDAEADAEARKRREWIAKHFPALTAAAKPEPGWQLPKLTAEQQAEWEEKKERIAQQIAEPNTRWDELGASVLKLALADTKLVDAAWLAALADAGGVLPRCQDLPAEAVVTYEEMAKCEYGLAVLVISYPWLDADHPDKNGLQLRKLAFVLKAAAKEAARRGCKFGVFWDYCALPQRSREASAKGEDDRTAEEKATFGRGLKGINEFYGHQSTCVLLVDTELPLGPKTNSQQYLKRGWCLMEYYASGIVKHYDHLISLSKLSGKETRWFEVREKGKAGRAPPMAPTAFAVKLESGVATGEVGFTNKGDVPLVTGIYDKAFMTEMTKATALYYGDLKWDDAQGVQLCEALRHAHAHGGLRELTWLILDGNKLGDGFVTALVALLDQGGLANVELLALDCNAISDAGMRELAAAVARGGLPKCTVLALHGNPGSDAPVQQALAQR